MVEDYKKAMKYLTKAMENADQKGFSSSIQLLLYLKEKKYDLMQDYFKKTIMLPENQKVYDNFALGWSYTFMSESSFEQKNYDDGIKYLFKAITFLLEDLYFLEAQYVSLLLYRYNAPTDYIKLFRELEPKDSILSQFKNYVEKHVSIRDNYYSVFYNDNGKGNGIPNLQKFYIDIKDINDINYNPDIVKEIMDEICLF
jgi:tetratricopeptide (TPR) repeat protein